MNVTGVVLAGGRSSRMGTDKALLLWQGRTLLDHAVTLLQTAGASRVLVSGRPDHPQGFADLLPHAGPPAAVFALLRHLQAEQCLDGRSLLLIPVDMPLLAPATLATLLEQWGAGVARHYTGEVFPCVVPASSALLEHLQELYQESTARGGARSMKGLFAWLQAAEIEPAAQMLREFLNINTPEDLHALPR